VAYEALLRAWNGEYGDKDPAAAYRAFQQAVTEPDYDAFGTFLVLIGALSWMSIIKVNP